MVHWEKGIGKWWRRKFEEKRWRGVRSKSKEICTIWFILKWNGVKKRKNTKLFLYGFFLPFFLPSFHIHTFICTAALWRVEAERQIRRRWSIFSIRLLLLFHDAGMLVLGAGLEKQNRICMDQKDVKKENQFIVDFPQYTNFSIFQFVFYFLRLFYLTRSLYTQTYE